MVLCTFMGVTSNDAGTLLGLIADEFPGRLSGPVIPLAANLRLKVTIFLDIGVMPLQCFASSIEPVIYMLCFTEWLSTSQVPRPSNALFEFKLHVTLAMQLVRQKV